MDINDLNRERVQAVEQMRALNDTAAKEKRDLTAEETATWDDLNKQVDAIKAKIDRQNALDAVARESALFNEQRERLVAEQGKGEKKTAVKQHPRETAEYTEAFWNVARRGRSNVGIDVTNALEVGTNSEGGYVVPVEFERVLIKSLETYNALRTYCRVIQTASERRIPVETDTGAASWIDEEAAYPESDPVFGQVTLAAHKLARIIKVSEELMRDAFFDMQTYIADNYGRTFGYAEETAFLTGDGSGKPTGLVVTAQAGVTAAGTTAVTGDELISLFYTLKRPYRANATWVLNDMTIAAVRKLKLSDGQYVWTPGLQDGEPDRILGRPVVASDAVETMAAGDVAAVFGDLSYYVIADRAGREMQRLNELYAATGQIGFKMNQRVDGKLTLPEAVKKLTMAAS